MSNGNKDFFKKQSASSLIKSKIVAEYFPQYSRIISPQEEIIYLDLFAGPGIYEDGSPSTPILLSRHIANDATLRNIVQLAFNDNQYAEQLKANFNQAFPPGTFTKVPRFGNKTVGADSSIQTYLSKPPQKNNKRPTLLFFDPWGYKGIDTATLANFLDSWGNELFLFINIKRIHAAIENEKFEDLMRALFPQSFDRLKRDRKFTSSVFERLSLIMENIANEFQTLAKSKLFHAAFRFQEEDSDATSHYIIHFCKHQKGYELVKQIYHDFDNVGSILSKNGDYTFDAKNIYSKKNYSDTLFGDLNILSLSNDLELEFKGQEIRASALFKLHQVKTKFCGTHYTKTLRHMVDNNVITAKFTDTIGHKVNVLLIDDCILNFK